ncbi:Serine/threonine-protein kinase grp [Nymphon striatum]|nr:Serine/threonine-protein kinase grp [Nymphon striatum]
MSEFVKGWDIVEVLGEGAYGEVQLLINRQTNEAVAVKVVDLEKHTEVAKDFEKEIRIHRMLKNPHIIKYFGSRSDGNLRSIFLEYAPNGELFDRIEPDVGMPQADAHKFFSQLIAGVKHLHNNGIVHRDLKPENLLLDEHDNLKISDFGMATVFRNKGTERKLSRRCGTIPYIAPEVLSMVEYRAQPADIWSCGIILVALLAGELPWDKPMPDCVEYKEWKDTKITKSPWSKIENLALSLIRRILTASLNRRFTMEQIESHRWFNKKFKTKSSFSCLLSESNESSCTPMKRFCSGQISNSGSMEDRQYSFSASQPPLQCQDAHDYDLNSLNKEDNHLIAERIWFSQPARPENMLLSSQLQGTPSASQGPMQRLVKRLTRFFVSTSPHDTIKELKTTFDKLGFSWKLISPGQITITTLDRRKTQLIFKTNIIIMNDRLLVDFRLSRGDGIEFKRKFLQIQNMVHEIVVKGPVMWPVAIATNSIPK